MGYACQRVVRFFQCKIRVTVHAHMDTHGRINRRMYVRRSSTITLTMRLTVAEVAQSLNPTLSTNGEEKG